MSLYADHDRPTSETPLNVDDGQTNMFLKGYPLEANTALQN